MTDSTNSVQEAEPIGGFRKKVAEWLEKNAVVPADIVLPGRGRPMSPELKEWAVQFRRKLGANGWIAPNWPRKYGGGGLSTEHAAIIQQELRKWQLPTLQVGIMHTAPFRVYGTEDQKTTILASILRGELTVANTFTEVDHGSDLGSTDASAVKDADDYVINATKDFITSPLPPDLFLCLAQTNPQAPEEFRHSVIIVDADSPGVLIKAQRLLTPGREQTIYYSDVHVTRSRLLGEEGQGMEIAAMMVEIERGGISVPLLQQLEIENREAEEA